MLAYGVDADTINKAFLKVVAVPGKSVMPVESWAYNEDVTKYNFDKEKAVALLKEAGWVDEGGDGGHNSPQCFLLAVITTL